MFRTEHSSPPEEGTACPDCTVSAAPSRFGNGGSLGRISRRLLRALYWAHRWIGIGTCVLFAIWFASGLVMMYVPFPSLTDEEYLRTLAPIEWSRVEVTPTAALAAAGVAEFPRALVLEMWNGQPVYRVRDAFVVERTISAVNGSSVTGIDAAQAVSSAGRRINAPVRGVRTIERDQWSVAGRFDAHRPLHVVEFEDPRGTTLYVSSQTGAVVLDTTRRERMWNWLGAVPHWIYFTVLRKDQPLWRQVILWVSGVGIVGAVTGFWIGILRLRVRRRYRGVAFTPYRGWMKWHHVAGLIGGVFLFTWIVSGWLSVNPNRWFESPGVEREALHRLAGHTAPSFEDAGFASAAKSMRNAVRVRFAWFDSTPLMLVTNRGQHTIVLNARSGQPERMSDARIFAAAMRLFPDTPMPVRERLTAEDSYWYSHHERRRLPVLRAGFADANETWVHFDPDTGEILGSVDRAGRANRWWFDALHSLDFRWLIQHRPAWDIAVWVLSALGLVTSVSGVVIGWRRLTRARA
ncbi:MAG: PepSY domain-containing protein [Steroidobacteraceae bacterium]|nr:PepSY domain-containing protein [Steroidobacteraceae bacterium]